MGFEPGTRAQFLPVVPAVKVGDSKLELCRVTFLEVELTERSVTEMVVVLQCEEDRRLVYACRLKEKALGKTGPLGVLKGRQR